MVDVKFEIQQAEETYFGPQKQGALEEVNEMVPERIELITCKAAR